MSTNNFAFENILVAIEDDEGAELFEGVYQGELQAELTKVFPKGSACDKYLADGLSRSYGGRVLFEVPVHYRTGGTWRTVQVVVRSGYYSGLNLDYVIKEHDDTEWDGDKAVEPTKAMQATLERTCRKVGRVLRSYGTELRKVAQFSNGEAVYELA